MKFADMKFADLDLRLKRFGDWRASADYDHIKREPEFRFGHANDHRAPAIHRLGRLYGRL